VVLMNEQAKSDLLGKLPYGLYVVTSDAGDDRGGMLVTWVMQASFDPPMVAVAMQNTAHTYAVIKRSGTFALNFMPDTQRNEAGSFGQEYAKVGDKLGKYPHHPGPTTGSPILDDALGYLECRVKGWVAGGDHDVALAEIVEAQIVNDAALMTTMSSGMGYSG
jgi:flavin reductase (DIM6/NTAB) family NADH-FMN oxidoreductase RutF